MNKKVLRKYFEKTMGTIELMDEFETVVQTVKEDFVKKYDELWLDNVFMLYHNDTIYYVGMTIMNRYPSSKEYFFEKVIPTDMTFSNFKRLIAKKIFRTDYEEKYGLELIDETISLFMKNVDNMIFGGKEEYLKFDVPITLNAQNSSNRNGYGWEWYGDTCLYEGTLYGETTTYIITGIYLTKSSAVAYKSKISGVITYHGFNRLVREHDITSKEQEILKHKYKDIEREFIQVDGDEIIWSNRIVPKQR